MLHKVTKIDKSEWLISKKPKQCIMKYSVQSNNQNRFPLNAAKNWLILPLTSLALISGSGVLSSESHSTAMASETTGQTVVAQSADSGNLGTATYSWNDSSKTLTINGAGIMSKVSALSFANDIQTIRFTGAVQAPVNSDHLLAELPNLTSIDGLTYLDTSNVTSMYYMFRGDAKVTSLDVSHFDTSKVTDMSAMFSDMTALQSLDVRNFDTSQVVYFRYLFSNDASLKTLDLSHFNTSNATTMYGMFSMASGLTRLDISSFDTQKVVADHMDYMFNGIGNGDLLYINMPKSHFTWWSLLGDTWKGNRYDHLYTPINNPDDRETTGTTMDADTYRKLYDTGNQPGGWYVWGRYITSQESKVVKRTINYQDASGHVIASSTVQQLTYQRTVTKDMMNNTTTKTDWVVTDGQDSQFAAVTVPATIDSKYEDPKVNGQTVTMIAAEKPKLTDTADEQDEVVNVLYSMKAVTPTPTPSPNNKNHHKGISLPTTGGDDGQSNQVGSTRNSKVASRKLLTQLPSTGQQVEKHLGLLLPLALGISATLAYFFTKSHK